MSRVRIKRQEKKIPARLLSQTLSVCPRCLRRINASYVERGGKVYMEKSCPEHGRFSVPVWTDAKNFLRWQGSTEVSLETVKDGTSNCPHDCGICANHKQPTCCVLMEVTARCNLRCPVCFASSGEKAAPEDPGMEQISEWYDMLMGNGGPFNIQLSGGEPTMRDDLDEIIRMGREKGFSFFQLNTNGLRLARQPEYLEGLAKAGLNTVFLQFDGFSKESSVKLRGDDLISEKKQAIANCKAAGVGVVLVPTVMGGVNDDQLGAILDFAADNMPMVRGVHFQPASFFGRSEAGDKDKGRITLPDLFARIEVQTAGRVKARDFMPSNAEHPLCGFHADFAVVGGRWKLQGGGGSCCGGVSSSQARQAVARKWSAPVQVSDEPLGADYDLSSLDDFLKLRREKTLAISGMAFQDAWNLDLKRLQRCYIHEISPDGQLIPFCAYNLSSADGETIYRK